MAMGARCGTPVASDGGIEERWRWFISRLGEVAMVTTDVNWEFGALPWHGEDGHCPISVRAGADITVSVGETNGGAPDIAERISKDDCGALRRSHQPMAEPYHCKPAIGCRSYGDCSATRIKYKVLCRPYPFRCPPPLS